MIPMNKFDELIESLGDDPEELAIAIETAQMAEIVQFANSIKESLTGEEFAVRLNEELLRRIRNDYC